MLEALTHAGNRDIVLYRPTDGLRGAAGFYRNRTAQEIRSPDILVSRLADGRNEVVALLYWIDKDELPRQLLEAAQSEGRDLQIEASFRLGKKYLLLVSAGVAGREAEIVGERMGLQAKAIFRETH
jgi:hypothetical protein